VRRPLAAFEQRLGELTLLGVQSQNRLLDRAPRDEAHDGDRLVLTDAMGTVGRFDPPRPDSKQAPELAGVVLDGRAAQPQAEPRANAPRDL
jgi:hypothetical protein